MNPLPPHVPHQPPRLQSMFPQDADEYPAGVPEPSSEDWLWYHPGVSRPLLSLTYGYLCVRCDVVGLRKAGERSRCWNCGAFCAAYNKVMGYH